MLAVIGAPMAIELKLTQLYVSTRTLLRVPAREPSPDRTVWPPLATTVSHSPDGRARPVVA